MVYSVHFTKNLVLGRGHMYSELASWHQGCFLHTFFTSYYVGVFSATAVVAVVPPTSDGGLELPFVVVAAAAEVSV